MLAVMPVAVPLEIIRLFNDLGMDHPDAIRVFLTVTWGMDSDNVAQFVDAWRYEGNT
jgi:hypothetical protein